MDGTDLPGPGRVRSAMSAQSAADIDPGALGASGPPAEFAWDARDCMLYALGVGAGSDELAFSAATPDLQVLPTFVVLANQRAPRPEVLDRIDRSRVLHAEQEIELFEALAAPGRVTVQSQVVGVYDKGSGALVVTEIEGRSPADPDRLVFRTRSSAFVRGAGGWGGPRGVTSRPERPARRPDAVVRYRTGDDQALLYRLSGDHNPLHCDPEFARRAGFPRPILHGLCTFGFAGRALLSSWCDSEPARLAAMGARFTKPVFPGTELAVSVWADDDDAVFFVDDHHGDVVVGGGTARRAAGQVPS